MVSFWFTFLNDNISAEAHSHPPTLKKGTAGSWRDEEISSDFRNQILMKVQTFSTKILTLCTCTKLCLTAFNQVCTSHRAEHYTMNLVSMLKDSGTLTDKYCNRQLGRTQLRFLPQLKVACFVLDWMWIAVFSACFHRVQTFPNHITE